MKTLVISGINLFEGGPLSIFYDCLDEIINSGVYKEYHIIAFIHKALLFRQYKDKVTLIELPKARKNYLYRLYYEYCYFRKFSRGKNIDIWISLHDITPNVKADRIYTYCHNPSPFLKKDIRKISVGAKTVAFSFLYKYLYRINIKSASAVVVQQDWMRQEFLKMYPIDNVVVAQPNMPVHYQYRKRSRNNPKKIFIYAAYPRYFKNYEQLLAAAKMLEDQQIKNFEIWVTIKGNENSYARKLKKQYENLKSVVWLGLRPREEVFKLYDQADCLVFPSLIETWGLPISEFKPSGKPMLLADLPYTHEALGEYTECCFFDVNDTVNLFGLMKNMLEGTLSYDGNPEHQYHLPYFPSWSKLLNDYILETDFKGADKHYNESNSNVPASIS